MKIRLLVTVIIAVALVASAWFLTRPGQPKDVSETKIESNESVTKKTELIPDYGKIPLHFEANAGQVDEQVKFLSRGSGYSLFLTSDEAVLALQKPTGDGQEKQSDTLRMKFAGAISSPAITGEKPLEGKTNYFTSNDPGKWKTDIANFERVRFSNVYDGVDVVYYGNGQQLEYDLVVGPNVSPDKIELNFTGAEDLTIADNGDLVFKFGESELLQHKPVAYQEIDGERREVAANYRISNLKSEISNLESQIADPVVGFEIGDYDHSRPLIIDPVLSYATYLGGAADTFGTSIAVDSSGSAYVTGSTNAVDFPTVNPFQSTPINGEAAFVTKLNPAGTAFVYSTYLGAANTFATGIKVDAQGSAFVAGLTGSSQFPTTSGAYLRTAPVGGGFITKLSPDGASLIYSTYLASPTGGGRPRELNGIDIDSSGNAYLTGYTQETTFPTTPGAFKPTMADGIQNSFVTKLNATGSALVYSTFVGVSVPIVGSQAIDQAKAIAVDPSGNAYITGTTVSQNFPVTSGAFQIFPGGRRDAFVTKLNANGSALIYSTYLGGGGQDAGTGIAVDAMGNAYVTGSFEGGDFPFTPNAFRNGADERCCGSFTNSFLTKINPTGSALVYSTALSLGGGMSGSGVAVGSDGSAYVIGGEGLGAAYSVNAVQSVSRSNDAYIVKMNPAGTGLAYSTYLGGSNGGAVGSAIALDSAGNAYVDGYTTASDFPVTSGAPQSTKPGGQSNSAFIAKIGVQTNDCPAITINPQPLPAAIFNQSYNQQLTATGGGAPYTFSLAPNFGSNFLPRGLTLASDGTISGTPTTRDFGTYLVTVQAVAANGCIGIRTLQLVFVERQPILQVSVLGRGAILRGRENRYTFAYTNNGDADVFMVPLIVRIPRYFTWRPDFRLLETMQPLQGPAINYSQVPLDYQKGDLTVIPLLLPRIAAHSTGSVSIVITVPNLPDYANVNFQIDAQLGSPLLSSVPAAAPGSQQTVPSRQLTPRAQGFCAESAQRPPGLGPNSVLADPSTDCLQSIAQIGFDILGFAPGATCAQQVGLFVAGQATSYFLLSQGGGSSAGTFAGALAGAYSTAVGCALASSPIGVIINAVQTSIDIAGAIVDCNPPSGAGSLRGRTVSSNDPNDKVGSSGVGTERYLSGDIAFPYIIYFENKATATAPAQEVVVTDQLDVSKFDLNTFSFGDVTIGGLRLAVLPNKRDFNKDFDLRPANNIIARINSKLDTATGIITWRFQSIDPATGQPTDDPLAGFLPPNGNPPQGEASVMFTVKLKSGLVTGTEIRNKARIVFDTNAAIDTPEWFNTIDTSKPVSSVAALPTGVASNFPVFWSGTDVGAGIGSYTIFVSDNGGPFAPVLLNTPLSNGTFTGQTGHTYGFYAIARDKTGNEEPAKTTAEATTTVNLVSISGRVVAPDGRGLRNTTVSITDPNGVRRTATTSSFGFYQFDNVLIGQQYLMGVSSRLYRFATRTLQVTDTLTNIDFVGLE